MSELPQPHRKHVTQQHALRSIAPLEPVSNPSDAAPASSSAAAERTRRMVAIMSNRARGGDGDQTMPDAAEVIATVIRFATRRGRSLAALPASTRRQLFQLCEAGDPATLVVRDWLECRLPVRIEAALECHRENGKQGRA
jgi:hypothetical protein